MINDDYSELEVNLHMVLDRLSNGESVEISEDLITGAVNTFEETLRKQITARSREFRLRMSNIGKPTCQLQMDKAQTDRSRMPYNHVVRMMIGDAVESFIVMLIKASNINVTGANDEGSMTVNGTVINGTDDIEFDNEVWDVKTCSPYAFDNKWVKGWDGIYEQDEFGYVDQLFGYATAKNKKMGGWVVINKSTGEVRFVHANPTKQQLQDISDRISATVTLISSDAPFKKMYDEEEEFFRNKPTGNSIVPRTCTYCSYMAKCWPDAEIRPKALSKAKTPIAVWYTKYVEQEE